MQSNISFDGLLERLPDSALLSMAEHGDTDAQIMLGHLYQAANSSTSALQQALQWFFIARNLGNSAATSPASAIMELLNEDDLEEAYEKIECWFTEKIEAYRCGQTCFADPLMKWLTADSLPHEQSPRIQG